jgi:hypothetical protein
VDLAVVPQYLRSGNFSKQVEALQFIFQQLSRVDAFPSSEIMSAIVEFGLSSESPQVREKSFRLVQFLYIKKRPYRWSDIRSAVHTEFSTAENVKSISAAIGVLATITDTDLILFCISRESTTAIKECCESPDENVRRVSILGFGKLLFRVWRILFCGSLDLEGIIKVESASELARVKEDFSEFMFDVMKSISSYVNGHPLPIGSSLDASGQPKQPFENSFGCFEACCEVVAEVFEIYNECFDNIFQYALSLLGSSPYSNVFTQIWNKTTYHNINWTNDECAKRCQTTAAGMIPLVQRIIREIGNDPFGLISRWKAWHPCQSCARLITGFIIIILHEAPCGAYSQGDCL